MSKTVEIRSAISSSAWRGTLSNTDMEFSEESRLVAKYVFEELGGLEYIKEFDLPRAGKDGDKLSVWNVYICVYCHAPIWVSTSISQNGEDGWHISDRNSWEAAFGTCPACEQLQSQMSPSAIALAQRNAVATLIFLGKILQQEKLR